MEVTQGIEITFSWDLHLKVELCKLQISGQFQAPFSAPNRPTTEICTFSKGKQNRLLKHKPFNSDLNVIILLRNTFYGLWLVSEKIL